MICANANREGGPIGKMARDDIQEKYLINRVGLVSSCFVHMRCDDIWKIASTRFIFLAYRVR